jgi:hypothetical protein
MLDNIQLLVDANGILCFRFVETKCRISVSAPPTTSFLAHIPPVNLPKKSVSTRTKLLAHVDGWCGSGLSQK